MEFKVGDRVTIDIGNGTEGWHEMSSLFTINASMGAMNGNVVTIERILHMSELPDSEEYPSFYSDGMDVYMIKVEENSWSWSDRCFKESKNKGTYWRVL